MNLGRRIRKLRQQRGLRLEDVARGCGFTKSLLSKIENGKTVPPVATLSNIARHFDVTLPALLEQASNLQTVFTAAGGKRAAQMKTAKGYAFRTLASERLEKAMQPFVFTARRGQVRPELLSHAGEEFIYMLRGRMRYRVGEREYRLSPGDSLYFDSDEAHDLVPLSAEVTFLAVFYRPPSIERRPQNKK